MNPITQHNLDLTRRTFIGASARGIGSIALGSLLLPHLVTSHASAAGGIADLPHFFPKAKRVLCLFQSGGMSHIDLFDQKKTLYDFAGQDQRSIAVSRSAANRRRTTLWQERSVDQRSLAAHANDC